MMMMKMKLSVINLSLVITFILQFQRQFKKSMKERERVKTLLMTRLRATNKLALQKIYTKANFQIKKIRHIIT